MLADAMVVPTVAVTDLDRAKRFFEQQVGLPLLDETRFACRFGAGKGTQMSWVLSTELSRPTPADRPRVLAHSARTASRRIPAPT